MGLFGGGNSSSTSSTETQNISQGWDNRQSLQGSVGATGGGSNYISTVTTDPGALAAMQGAMLANYTTTRDALDAVTRISETSSAASAAAAAGAMSSMQSTTNSAFDFAAKNDALQADGFTKLLGAGLDLLNKAYDSTSKTQQFTADAYQTASAELSGSLDNKTIMILGLGGLAVLGLMFYQKR